MKILRGGNAFPPFRVHQIEKACAAALGKRAAISANFIYLLDLVGGLSDEDVARACELLGAADAGPAEKDAAIYVSPRKGTISPWSSKASDIFRNCGLDTVRRVERAVEIRLEADGRALAPAEIAPAFGALHDRMIEGVYTNLDDLFDMGDPRPGRTFDVLGEGAAAIERANQEMGLALSPDEIDYLVEACRREGKNPTDTELVMFGQVNSEHCRHKIFNAEWVVDGEEQPLTLFQMIKNTHARHPEGTLVAYSDNSGVMEGHPGSLFLCDPATRRYAFCEDQIDILMKVETHNHPTAISPFPGASTGVGGEIRDETATGAGSRSKAGLSGFITSHLRIPGYRLPWELDASAPPRLATPLQVVTEGSLGGASFGNEFGRPQLCGFFRTFEAEADGVSYGYAKPIMLAGGMGAIRRCLIHKQPIPPGSLIVQLGGPAMRIGLGGGAASSLASGANDEELDFNSVQRGNADVQRRCQEVINACVALGAANPILAIHDVGAGGLSNACPELVEKTGGYFNLREIHNEEPAMSPMEIWCCEAQERYVLAIAPQDRESFEALCARERCPVAFIGTATGDRRLILADSHFGDFPIDMDIDVLLGKPPRMRRDATRLERPLPPVAFAETPDVADAFERVLRHPAVADKTFLVTITDRSVTGMVHRDQMCGPYQLPVADHAITTSGYRDVTGSAMACGERTPVAVADAPASGRLAVTEAVLNIAAAAVGDIGRIKLSANWMCACGEPGEDAGLFDTVKAVGLDFCPALGLSIPVGKDSLSMRTQWNDPATGEPRRQISPLSLVVSAFAPVDDVRLSVTPDLKPGASSLVLADLANGRRRLGASILAQVFNIVGGDVPDMDDPAPLAAFFAAFQRLLAERRILAAHDRSDGGLAATVAEMCIAGGRGSVVTLPDATTPRGVLAALFNEEPGMVVQVAADQVDAVLEAFADAGVNAAVVGDVTDAKSFVARAGGATVLDMPLHRIRSIWSENSIRMRAHRENPASADEERINAADASDPGMTFAPTFDPEAVPHIRNADAKPAVAILREQGVNGHVEMAAAFALAGFDAVDVHMTDLLEGRIDLADFHGAIACGGFSYGDVLGAGSGWARSILYNPRLSDAFAAFFHRPDTFTLGVCNGCQMISQLKSIIPGAEDWPRFTQNVSEQFEARYCTVEVLDSPAVLLQGMAGSRLPIAVAHGEGFATFDSPASRERLLGASCASLRFVDNHGNATERYPFNPNGSKDGLTGFTSKDGRALVLMPHPERGFRSVQLSYRPAGQFAGEAGPWMRLFHNARAFV
ncbi:MAG: phosphoribosylformylglycinamidine synthase [Kiritimatiellia bacterium]